MPLDDKVRLQHILDAIEETSRFTAGKCKSDLATDRMLLYALIRCIEIIGEAANGISRELREQSPHIPWKSMIAMRHRLIHGYFDVDYEIVWTTVAQELPALAAKLRMLG